MNNENTIDGITFVVNVDEEAARFSNRFGRVLSVPTWYEGEIEVGDILLCHHNVFRQYKDWRGTHRDGRGFVDHKVYHVAPDKFFAYKKDGGEWKSWSKYLLVLPVPTTETWERAAMYEKQLIGKVMCSNDGLREQGVDDGDIVIFRPDSEYIFDIDGQKTYRMLTEQIVAKL